MKKLLLADLCAWIALIAVMSTFSCGCRTAATVMDNLPDWPGIATNYVPPAVTNVVPVPIPGPVTPPAPPVAATDALAGCEVVWLKADGSNAKVDVPLRSVKLASHKITYDWDCPKKGSGIWGNGSGDLAGLGLFWVWRDGKWIGGKYEWMKWGQTVKLPTNIEEGYVSGHGYKIIPERGERCAFGTMNEKGTSRTPAYEIPGGWPWDKPKPKPEKEPLKPINYHPDWATR